MSRRVPQVHVTRKPSGPTSKMEMKNGSTGTYDTKPSGPIGQMLKGPVGTRRMEKGLSGDFYDKLQASQMNNYRSTGTCRMEKGPTGTRRMEI